DAGLLAPEKIRHEADEAGVGELLRVAAHRVVDAPDLHDGDDRARRRAVRIRDMRVHDAVAQAHLHVLRPRHQLRFISRRALPARIRSFSVRGISKASIAASVARMRSRPRSASNGASVANTEWSLPKKAWPHFVAATAPFSAVSA